MSKVTGYDIKDKVVLVTGANRGIGKALVEGFLRHGARKVYAAVRNLTTANALVDTYGKDRVIPLYMDMVKPESIAQAAAVAQDVEVVVNNAGVLTTTDPLSENAIASLEHEMQVNVHGLIHVAQQFAPILKKNGGGVLVQLNSVASLRCSTPRVATYSASKAAAYSITQALRTSLQEQGTLVISVHPGPIATDMINAVGDSWSDIAEPPSQVAECVVEAMKDGTFHVFPDSRSQSVGQVYESYAKTVIEGDRMY